MPNMAEIQKESFKNQELIKQTQVGNVQKIIQVNNQSYPVSV